MENGSPAWWLAVGVVLAIVVAVVMVAVRQDETSSDLVTTSTSTSTSEPTSTEPASTSSTPTTAQDTTTTSTPTTTAPTTTQPATTTSTSTTPVVTPPGAPTNVTAGPSGGSGEIELGWTAAPGATGYRVLRSDLAGGPFTTVLDVDVATGVISAADDITNLWTDGATYLPTRWFSPPSSPPTEFHYVEYVVTDPRVRYFQVVAYNQAGEGPPSPVVCGAPPGLAC